MFLYNIYMGRTAKKRNGSRNKNKKGGTKLWDIVKAGGTGVAISDRN